MPDDISSNPVSSQTPDSGLLSRLHEVCPDFYPSDMQDRANSGLAILWPQMSHGDRSEMTTRLRYTDSIAAYDELLAADAFARQFGTAAIKWPDAPKGHRRPEFFVEFGSTRWAVECTALQDNDDVRELNTIMQATGQPWIEPLDPMRDPDRLHKKAVKKIERDQGRGPTVLLLSPRTPWLMPDTMDAVIQPILCTPSEVNIAPDKLPIAIACLTFSVVQGVWFCDSACTSTGIDRALRERIRNAITGGFMPRRDGSMFTESAWADCE